MKKSYETPSIWIEKRFTLSDEYMVVKISRLQGTMKVGGGQDDIVIADGTDDYETDSGITGFSGPSAKERNDEEWGILW